MRAGGGQGDAPVPGRAAGARAAAGRHHVSRADLGRSRAPAL